MPLGFTFSAVNVSVWSFILDADMFWLSCCVISPAFSDLCSWRNEQARLRHWLITSHKLTHLCPVFPPIVAANGFLSRYQDRHTAVFIQNTVGRRRGDERDCEHAMSILFRFHVRCELNKWYELLKTDPSGGTVGIGNRNLKDKSKSRPRHIPDSLLPKVTHFLIHKCPQHSYSPPNPGNVWFYFFLFPTRWYYDRDLLYALAMVRRVRTS